MSFMKENSLSVSLLSSLMLHGLAIAIASLVTYDSNLRREDFFPVTLVELSIDRKIQPDADLSRPISEQLDKLQETKPAKKSVATKHEPPATQLKREPTPEPIEAKPAAPAKTEAPVITSNARVEGGGSEAGAGNLFGKGDVGLVPGSGNGGGGGTAVAGLGRGSGAPGLPAQQTIFKTNREAKPIQTARATYPAMALRAGLEGDVTLRIEVDPQGSVTNAEIIKSGGAGFDEEALKAAKQSSFEPAQRNGQNIPAEFVYVYRFRLQR